MKGQQRHICNCCCVNDMNTANNARRKETILSIQRAYMSLAVSRSDLNSITVSDICKKAQINRTTFYSIYLDQNDLLEEIKQWMCSRFLSIFVDEKSEHKYVFDFYKLFDNIEKNQIFYHLYFKLGFDFKDLFNEKDIAMEASHYFPNPAHSDYHMEFFKAGITAIIHKWLCEGCVISAKEMTNILQEEYQKPNKF